MSDTTTDDQQFTFAAVTACPTGIAHSQMAAENLERAVAATGHRIHVEVQGAMGTQNELTDSDVDAADAVIIAADTAVDESRFTGTPVVNRPVGDAVTDVEAVLRDAIHAATASSEHDAIESTENDDVGGDEPTDGRAESDAATEEGVRAKEQQEDGLLTRLRRLFE